MIKNCRQAKAKLCAVAAIAWSMAGCGGDSEAPPPAPSTPPVAVAPQCTAALPVCTVTANPSSTTSNPLKSGTPVTLQATCNLQPDRADWLVNTARFATGLRATATPTTDPNTISTYTYRFEYSNCAGSNAAEVKSVVSNVVLTVTSLTQDSLTSSDGGLTFKLTASWDSNIPSTTQLHVVNAFTGVESPSVLSSTLTLHHVATIDGLVSGVVYRVDGISTVSGTSPQQTPVLPVFPH